MHIKENIKRRKAIALETMKKYNHIYKSHKLSIKTKTRHFNTYIEPIVLYHSEIWTTSNTIMASIDAFQRRLLRYAINMAYPRTVSSEKLAKLVKHTPWSQKIHKRRMTWLGHLFRLPEETPARQAFLEATKPHTRKTGHPPTSWIKLAETDLATLGHPIKF